MQSIWQRVAEDYAPFDVDVTTEDPGAADLARTRRGGPDLRHPCVDLAEHQRGQQALRRRLRRNGLHRRLRHVELQRSYQPAWIFPQNLGHDTKSIAEAVSHEVGHTLGLTHDGVAGGTSYYGGHATWAPIMGVGYSRPITQWSRGDYKGANNHQDDLSVIARNGLSLRPDEAGGTPSPTTTPPTGSAYITSDADRDVYTLGICSGPLTLAADPAAQSPNLDLKLSLLGVTGGPVAVDNPASRAGTPSRDVAIGMDAAVSRDRGRGLVLRRGGGGWQRLAKQGVRRVRQRRRLHPFRHRQLPEQPAATCPRLRKLSRRRRTAARPPLSGLLRHPPAPARSPTTS